MRMIGVIFLGVMMAGAVRAQEALATAPDDAGRQALTNQLSATDDPEARRTWLLDAARMYTGEGEYDAAERAYLKASQETPDDPEILLQLSAFYIMAERYAEAIDILTDLAEKFPGNSMLHNNLAWAYSAPGSSRDGEKALSHAREAVSLLPMAPSIWNTLAEAYYISGRYDEALRSSVHAMSLLNETKPDKKTVQEYSAQHWKIKRAQEARNFLEGKEDRDSSPD